MKAKQIDEPLSETTQWTPRLYRLCTDELLRSGWVCVGGMYPNSNASEYELVTWVGSFERKTGSSVERFMLSSKTVGSQAFQRAIGLYS